MRKNTKITLRCNGLFVKEYAATATATTAVQQNLSFRVVTTRTKCQFLTVKFYERKRFSNISISFKLVLVKAQNVSGNSTDLVADGKTYGSFSLVKFDCQN